MAEQHRAKRLLLGGRELLESLSSLSIIFDLANGLAEDKSLATATFAVHLAQELGMPPPQQWSVFLASLLRHLGCTAFASQESELAQDDIRLRSELLLTDNVYPTKVLKASYRASGLNAALRVAWSGRALKTQWMAEACDAARVLSQSLGLTPDIVTAIAEAFERTDGRGGPRGIGGDDISPVARVCAVAHESVLHFLAGGASQASDGLTAQMGKKLDAPLAQRARSLLPHFERSLSAYLSEKQPMLVSLAEVQAKPISLEELARAFGDFADLQSPFLRGHTRRVARQAAFIAKRMSFTEHEVFQLSIAALLHDLGQVAVPSAIWNVPRAHHFSERERMRMHVYFGERVLAGAAPLREVSAIVALHHERLDGSGYHRGLQEMAIGRAARVLAVADVSAALAEHRPHRPAVSPKTAAETLAHLARLRQLDPACVDAALSTGPVAPMTSTSLSERETDVVRLLAMGKTNKEIGRALQISPRTVQNHTLRIYQKLGVESRAGATLVAMQQGLLSGL
jgi:HD-GYP domain-containing protein (c-di-GMP phosphodiesterase class II)